MEYGTIEREIHVEADPDVVFEVISRPEHIREWWPDDAAFEPAPGSDGALTWAGEGAAEATVVPLFVVEVDPPRRFSFRWTHPEAQPATATNSLLVSFELVPTADGTTIHLTETGFREQGWEIAMLEEQYADHVTGWDYYLPRLESYAARLVDAR